MTTVLYGSALTGGGAMRGILPMASRSLKIWKQIECPTHYIGGQQARKRQFARLDSAGAASMTVMCHGFEFIVDLLTQCLGDSHWSLLQLVGRQVKPGSIDGYLVA